MSMIKGKLIFFLIMVGAITFPLLNQDKNQQHSIRGEAWGTTYRIKFYPEEKPTDQQLEAISSKINGLLDDISRQLSPWDQSSWISGFNQSNKTDWLPLPRHASQVMELSTQYHQTTQGKFDPAIGAIIERWGFGSYPIDRTHQHWQEPAESEIQQLMQKSGMSNIQLKENRIRKKHPQLKLDFSAISKGYAVDQIAALLRKEGIECFLVEFGGEVLAGNPPPTRRQGWRVKTPDGVISLANEAVATSGSQHQQHHGISHIIDPRTGQCLKVGYTHAARALTCAEADVMATVRCLPERTSPIKKPALPKTNKDSRSP